MTVTTGGRNDQVGLVALVGAELDVEGLEQLAVLVLGRDDLDDVVELLTDELERRVVDRLGRGDHLAEVEEHLHELGRVDAGLLGEVGQRGAAGETDGLAAALADPHAAQRRGVHGLELLATRALRLATTTRRTTGAAEGTLGLTALAGTVAATGTTTACGAEAATTGATGGTGAGRGTAARGAAGATRSTAGATATGSAGTAGTARTTGAAATGAASRRRPGTWASSPGWGAACRDAAGATVAAGRADAADGCRRPRRRARGAGRAGRRPMPWLEENGLLPGRGAPGRPTGRGRRGRAPCSRRCRCRPRRRAPRAQQRGRPGQPGASRLGRSGRGGGGRRDGLGRSGRRGLGLRGRPSGPGLGPGRADDFAAGFSAPGCRGRRSRRCGGGGRLQRLTHLLAETHLRRELDGRARRLDELPHLLELLENELALDAELLGELVHTGLSHNSPSWARPAVVRERASGRANSSGRAHRSELIECS